MAIEKLIGKAIPHYSKYGFKDLLGFSQRDGFIEILAMVTPNLTQEMEIKTKLEYLQSIYIHGESFSVLSDWLKSIILPKNPRSRVNIFIIDGPKWSRQVRSESFTRFCLIKQTNLNHVKGSADIFRDLRIYQIREKIFECQKKYARIYLDELYEILHIDKKLIISTINSMLQEKEIKGRYFTKTQSLVFDLQK